MKRILVVTAALFAALFALSFFSCDNSSGNPTVPPVSKKTSDWLFLFYFDADDDVLNDDISKNIRDEVPFSKS